MPIPVIPDFAAQDDLRVEDLNAANDALIEVLGGVVGFTDYAGTIDADNFVLGEKFHNSQKREARALTTLQLEAAYWTGPLAKRMELVEARLTVFLSPLLYTGTKGGIILRANGRPVVRLDMNPAALQDGMLDLLQGPSTYAWTDLAVALAAGAVLSVDASSLMVVPNPVGPEVAMPDLLTTVVELVLKEEHSP